MLIWLVFAQNAVITGLILRLNVQVRKHQAAIDKPMNAMRKLLAALYIKSSAKQDA